MQISWKHVVGDVNQLSVTVKSDIVLKLSGSAVGDSLLLTHFNDKPLSGPIALGNSAFFYAAVAQNEFFRLAAENDIKVGSFAAMADGNGIFGTLIDLQEEKLPAVVVTCSF